MSVQAIGWALDRSTSKGNARLVLICIANHADKWGDASWQHVDVLAKEANISTRAVQRALADLVAAGEIELVGKDPRERRLDRAANWWRMTRMYAESRGLPVPSPRGDETVTPSDQNCHPAPSEVSPRPVATVTPLPSRGVETVTPSLSTSRARAVPPSEERPRPESRPGVLPHEPSGLVMALLGVVVQVVKEAQGVSEGRHDPAQRAAALEADYPGMDLLPSAKAWSQWARFRRRPSKVIRDAWASLWNWIESDQTDGKLRPLPKAPLPAAPLIGKQAAAVEPAVAAPAAPAVEPERPVATKESRAAARKAVEDFYAQLAARREQRAREGGGPKRVRGFVTMAGALAGETAERLPEVEGKPLDPEVEAQLRRAAEACKARVSR